MNDDVTTGGPLSPEDEGLSAYLDSLIAASLARRLSFEATSPAPPIPEATRQETEKPSAEAPQSVASPPTAGAGDADALPGAEAPEPAAAEAQDASVFMRRFLRRSHRCADPPSSGIPDLDVRLGGGLGPGLHLVAGRPGDAKTALLLSAVWEAISGQRPALYYALREGSLLTWMRLAAALAALQAPSREPAVTLAQLRAGRLSESQEEALARLDKDLQSWVLPLLSLVDPLPAQTATLEAFVDDLRVRVRRLADDQGQTPLVLVDDLDRLLLLAAGRPLPQALALLDDALREACAPGLAAVVLPESLRGAAEALPVQTVLHLEAEAGAADAGFSWASLRVEVNTSADYTGALPLLWDRTSGLFTADPAAAEPGTS